MPSKQVRVTVSCTPEIVATLDVIRGMGKRGDAAKPLLLLGHELYSAGLSDGEMKEVVLALLRLPEEKKRQLKEGLRAHRGLFSKRDTG